GIKPILKGTFAVFAFPFGELVMFSMVFTTFKEKGIPKVYRKGLILSGILLLIINLTMILVLGVNIAEIHYFPSHETVRRINIGDFIQRIEILVSLIFLIGGITKVSMCLLAASKGVAKLFNFKDYRFIVTPIGIMMVNLTILSYESVMEMQKWTAEVWPYYSFLFQAILPIIIFVGVEVKRKMVKSI
ncbi:MAG: GerAB/ArcD/ProY family transporter, partial [Clostridiaceae bacterium]